MSAYFFSSVEHQLDAKRRIRIPAKFKDDLGKNYVMTAGSDGCILIMPFRYAREFQYKIAKMATPDERSRMIKLKTMELMTMPEEDAQGRLVLSKGLMQFAGIKKDVKFVGMGDYIALWAVETFNDRMSCSFNEADMGKGFDVTNIMPEHKDSEFED